MTKQKLNSQQTNKEYSTSEVLTGDVWIDGRPIYRKVIQATTNVTTAGNSAAIAHGITGLTSSMVLIGFTSFMKIGGGASSGGGQVSGYFEGTGTTVNSAGIVGFDSTSISLKMGYGGWGNTWSSTVLEYVK